MKHQQFFRLSIPFVFYFVLCLLFILPVSAQQKKLIQSLNETVIPVESVIQNKKYNDLFPLKQCFADVDIIALGESTHGTKEFFQFKHRMLAFLVEEMGYRVFAIEANFSEALLVNEYVLYGTGDPLEALTNMYFWTWNTREVLEMIMWMRHYNESKPLDERVRFYGFDMQFANIASREVLVFLKQTNPELYSSVYESLSLIRSPLFSFSVCSDSIIEQIKSDISITGDFLSLYSISESKTHTIKELLMIQQHYEILCQFIELQESLLQTEKKPYRNIRDSCMAENIRWIQNYEGAGTKVVVWAHNGHIAFGSQYQMGSFLKNMYGSRYYALGFGFGKGSFTAYGKKGLQEHTVSQGKRKSMGALFSQLNSSNFILDFKTGSENPAIQKYLNSYHSMWMIGASFGNEYHYETNVKLSENYNGLFFIRNTTAAQQNGVYYSMMVSFSADAEALRGKDIQFVAEARGVSNEQTATGYLNIAAFQHGNPVSLKTSLPLPITGDNWEKYSIRSFIDPSVDSLTFGLYLTETGEFIIDKMQIQIKDSLSGQWNPYFDLSFDEFPVGIKPEILNIRNQTGSSIYVIPDAGMSGNNALLIRRTYSRIIQPGH